MQDKTEAWTKDNVGCFVRRAKARSFSGCESRPATVVPAGSNRSSRGGKKAADYDRRLLTKAGEATLSIPKLRSLPFETAIIERYRRRESSSVEEALIEMYLAAVSGT